MSAIPDQSHPDIDRTRRLPLLTDEGRSFLAGRIDAKSYLAGGRRRAEQQAREYIARRQRHLWSRAERWAGYATLVFSMGFVILAIDLHGSGHPVLVFVSACTWVAVTVTVTVLLTLTRPRGRRPR